jgi:two-component system sensor histidine kinase AlgZ
LLLQPLVENAIKHGLADREEPGRIEVCVERQSSQLHIRVSDDGPGLSGPPADILSAGVGLSNTVERLEHLYGSEQQLTFHDAAGGGFEVRIRIPLRVAAADLVGSRT